MGMSAEVLNGSRQEMMQSSARYGLGDVLECLRFIQALEKANRVRRKRGK